MIAWLTANLYRRPRGRRVVELVLDVRPMRPAERWLWRSMARRLSNERTELKLEVRRLRAESA